MSAFRRYAPFVALLAAALLAGCGEDAPPPAHSSTYKPPVRAITPIDVTRIDLGTAASPDGTISQLSSSFKADDTIFAAVRTERPGHDIKLSTRWIYGDDSVIKDISKTISPANQAVTGFQVRNEAGWPIGQYKLEVRVNDQLVAVTAFSVTH